MNQQSHRDQWRSLLFVAAFFFFQDSLALQPSSTIVISKFYHRESSRLRHHGHSSSFSLRSTIDNNDDESPKDTSYTRLYFDIAIQQTPLGRLVFHLTPPTHPHHLPLHTSNLIALASSQRRSIDPKATYVGCTFQYSPSTIEDGSMRYRWGHVCEGYGRNGIVASSSRADDPIKDPESLMRCKHSCFGGVYYGMAYQEVLQRIDEQHCDVGQREAVLLTVPISGLGAGTSKFSIVRVSESPKEWGERLLLNSAVVGYLDCDSLDVLQGMARQRVGVPKIVDCGLC